MAGLGASGGVMVNKPLQVSSSPLGWPINTALCHISAKIFENYCQLLVLNCKCYKPIIFIPCPNKGLILNRIICVRLEYLTVFHSVQTNE